MKQLRSIERSHTQLRSGASLFLNFKTEPSEVQEMGENRVLYSPEFLSKMDVATSIRANFDFLAWAVAEYSRR